MKEKEKHIVPPSIDEIIQSIENISLRSDIVFRLKNSNPTDEEVIGVKKFLEKNDNNMDKLNQFLKGSHQSIDLIVENQNQRKSNKIWLKAAVVLIPILIVSTYFIFNARELESSQDLYSKYYIKEIGLPVTLSVNSKKLFDESMNLYRNEEYSKAIMGFEKLRETNVNNDTLNYFIGVSYLELKDFEKSLKYLSEDFLKSAFKEEVDFRLVLLNYKMNEIDKSIQILNSILENSNHKYYKESKSFLQDLSSKK